LAGRFRVERDPRPVALLDAAFFLAGLRADCFVLVDFFAAFFAGFRVAFFADFLVAFFADFLVAFFADFAPVFFADFFVDFRDAAGREPLPRLIPPAAAEPLPLRPEPGAGRSGVSAGAE
jgi:hypothetical protein